VHNADVQNIIPLFWEDELIGWAAGVTHVLDVGSHHVSGMPIGPIDRYEDGFILSSQKIGSEDRVWRDYELRSETAVRMPWYWRLDEKTRITGCQMIRDSVHRVIEQEGIDTYKHFRYCRAPNAPAKKTSGSLSGEICRLSTCPTTIQ
jgi:N-methylhydantoinase B/oxoprolinase/acetone carboxylase alpha subunit